MEFLLAAPLYICIVIIFLLAKRALNRRPIVRKYTYAYTKKPSIMTKSEFEFYNKMNSILGEKYYAIPQVHLSSFLNHKIPGQNWRGAFASINGKSVDFLICSKLTSQPVIAIELDDYTHNREDRRQRDLIVEDIFASAQMPLVRFKAGEWNTSSDVFEKIRDKLIHA